MTMIGIARRNWALRVSIVLNVCVLFYVCVHFRSSGPWIEEPTANWGSPLSDAFKATELVLNVSLADGGKVGSTKETGIVSNHDTRIATTKETAKDKTTKENDGGKNGNATTTQKQDPISTTMGSMTLEEAIPCSDKSTASKTAQRGEYWVLYNYVPMSTQVKCWESVTYTTHADYTFLDNLEPLIKRWQAPVSIAMYAPGTDFGPTLDAIKYLRVCGSPLISQLVTFHVFFSSKHIPKSVVSLLDDVNYERNNVEDKNYVGDDLENDNYGSVDSIVELLESQHNILFCTGPGNNQAHEPVPSSEKVLADGWNCKVRPPWENVTISKMYKSEKKLLYPVNVGRNIAREWAPTHYVLPSDIELYPSPDLAPKFLEMIRKRDQQPLYKPNPKVFPLSIFEVRSDSKVPANKTQLKQMLKTGKAIPFHKQVCSGCHNVPKSKEWQEAPETDGLHVFHVGKRTGSFIHWEPIFIGTNNDPLYDERLSWEGKSDKMTQGYALCVLDYDFLILDNAFLVHKPGIKVYKKDSFREVLSGKTNALIRKIIMPELKVLYGSRKGCAV